MERRLPAGYMLLVCVLTAHGGTPVGVRVLERPPDPDSAGSGSIVYWEEVRREPRPVHLHFLRVELSDPAIEVTTFISDDPDGGGPAEASLTPPLQLAGGKGVVAAVNANAFWHLPGSQADREKRGWTAGDAVHMFGLVVADGKERSPSDSRRIPLWIDTHGRARVGFPEPCDAPQQAVADWEGPLLMGGRSAAEDVRHPYPRTLGGVDPDGRRLLLVVVEGKQPGYSEGLTLCEAADIMREHGCWNAVNFDGGGSSLMLVATNGVLRPVGRRPDRYLRPIPVMLGVRAPERIH